MIERVLTGIYKTIGVGKNKSEAAADKTGVKSRKAVGAKKQEEEHGEKTRPTRDAAKFGECRVDRAHPLSTSEFPKKTEG